MSRFQFVADNCATFEVKRLCELVEIERSSYYAWKAGAPARAERAAADAALAERIRVIHRDDSTVGAPRMTAELNDGAPADQRVNHKRVARVMRTAGITGYVKKRRVRTTIPDQADQKVPDLLKRDFTANGPNRRYVGDITYLPLADGQNLYLATVIDCYSRRIAGWAVADHMRTELVEDALNGSSLFETSPGSRHVTALYMTQSDARGMPNRPRAARTANGLWTEGLLRDWEHIVKRAEAGIAAHVTGCPQCDGDDGLDARDQLEALILRGGKRGARVSTCVTPLDERFRRATTPSPSATEASGWWRYRNLD